MEMSSDEVKAEVHVKNEPEVKAEVAEPELSRSQAEPSTVEISSEVKAEIPDVEHDGSSDVKPDASASPQIKTEDSEDKPKKRERKRKSGWDTGTSPVTPATSAAASALLPTPQLPTTGTAVSIAQAVALASSTSTPAMLAQARAAAASLPAAQGTSHAGSLLQQNTLSLLNLQHLQHNAQSQAAAQQVVVHAAQHAAAQAAAQAAQQAAANAAIQAAQMRAAALCSRIYVGSMTFETTEEQIRAAFAAFGPLKSITYQKDALTGKGKGFAFVEYVAPESANAALATMNNFILNGRPIKVGRPNNVAQLLPTPAVPSPAMFAVPQQLQLGLAGVFNNHATGIPSNAAAAAAAVAAQLNAQHTIAAAQAQLQAQAQAQAQAAQHMSVATARQASGVTVPGVGMRAAGARVYVGSIHWDITEEDIKSIFGAFGQVRTCTLMPNPETAKHKGYGFVEYETEQAAEDSIAAMNGFELGGRKLKVGKANSAAPPNSQTGAFAAALVAVSPSGAGGVASQVQSGAEGGAAAAAHQMASLIASGVAHGGKGREETLSHEENLTIRGNQRLLIMQKLARNTEPKPSRCMVLKNMVGPKDVDEELETEVTDECGKYGVVDRVVIYQERQSERDDDVIVKIFVFFRNTDGSKKAVEKLNNRWFGGRIIRAELYEEDRFSRQDYSG